MFFGVISRIAPFIENWLIGHFRLPQRVNLLESTDLKSFCDSVTFQGKLLTISLLAVFLFIFHYNLVFKTVDEILNYDSEVKAIDQFSPVGWFPLDCVLNLNVCLFGVVV